MSDKTFVVELPEDLLERATAAHLDLRQLFIETLEQNLPAVDSEIVEIIMRRLTATKLNEALQSVRKGERVFGLHAGAITVSDDFDDPLPDSFWLGNDS